MKKSIVILFFVLATIVVISPGIVGRLAEELVFGSENMTTGAGNDLERPNEGVDVFSR